jgi:hypothetical protein
MNRREFFGFLAASALSGDSVLASDIAFSADSSANPARIPEPQDFSIRIAPIKVELSPGHVITTVGYNGNVPGPVLRVE